MRDLYERFESFTNGLKNLAIIVSGFALIIFLWPSISSVISGEKDISSIGMFGMNVSLSEAVNNATKNGGSVGGSIQVPNVKAAEKIEVGGDIRSGPTLSVKEVEHIP